MITLPTKLVCVNEKCFARDLNSVIDGQYCPYCGEKLKEQLADLYVELSYNLNEPQPPTDINKTATEVRKSSFRISLKDFIRMLKAYEKEVFVEDL